MRTTNQVDKTKVPLEFLNGKYRLRLLKISACRKAVIYESIEGPVKYYEVHKIRIAKARTFPDGSQLPEREILAGHTEYGKYAKAPVLLARAEELFDKAVRGESWAEP